MLEVEFTPAPRVLVGLAEIAAYLRISPRTAQRWIEKAALPALRGPSNKYRTTTSMIDLWLISVWGLERKALQASKAGASVHGE
jgi:hypothetical protein